MISDATYRQIADLIIGILTEAEFKLPPGTIRQINGGRYVLKNSRWHRIEPGAPAAAVKLAIKGAKISTELEALREKLQRKIDNLEPVKAGDYEALLDKVDAKYWKLRDREDAIGEAIELERNQQYAVKRDGQNVEINSKTSDFGDFTTAPQTLNISPTVDGKYLLKYSEERYQIKNPKPGEPKTMIRTPTAFRIIDKMPKFSTQAEIDKFWRKNAPEPLGAAVWID
jgi:hypothetical protein